MKRIKLIKPSSLAFKPLLYLKSTCDSITLVKWSLECVTHVLPNFAEEGSKLTELELALRLISDWLEGNDNRKQIREAAKKIRRSLRTHEDPVSRLIAKSCQQALSTIRNMNNSIYASLYALQSINIMEDGNVYNEIEYQYGKLLELKKLEKKEGD